MDPVESSEDLCALCSAVADATRYTEPFLYNSKLFESDRFVVVPSLGPLVPGHVMIVSKEHRESLASVGPAALKDAEDGSDEDPGVVVCRGLLNRGLPAEANTNPWGLLRSFLQGALRIC